MSSVYHQPPPQKQEPYAPQAVQYAPYEAPAYASVVQPSPYAAAGGAAPQPYQPAQYAPAPYAPRPPALQEGFAVAAPLLPHDQMADDLSAPPVAALGGAPAPRQEGLAASYAVQQKFGSPFTLEARNNADHIEYETRKNEKRRVVTRDAAHNVVEVEGRQNDESLWQLWVPLERLVAYQRIGFVRGNVPTDSTDACIGSVRQLQGLMKDKLVVLDYARTERLVIQGDLARHTYSIYEVLDNNNNRRRRIAQVEPNYGHRTDCYGVLVNAGCPYPPGFIVFLAALVDKIVRARVPRAKKMSKEQKKKIKKGAKAVGVSLLAVGAVALYAVAHT